MTPRDLRRAIREGRMTAHDPRVYKHPPEPPEDLSHMRRKRLAVAIQAAVLFLQGKDWAEIMGSLSNAKLIRPVVTKARIAQYVKGGVDYLLEQECFVEVRKRRRK